MAVDELDLKEFEQEFLAPPTIDNEAYWHLGDLWEIPAVQKFVRGAGKVAVFGLTAAGLGAAFASTDIFRTPSKTTVGPGVDVEYTPTRDSAFTLKVAFGAEIVKPLPEADTHGLGARAEITNLPDFKKLGLSNLGEQDQQAVI